MYLEWLGCSCAPDANGPLVFLFSSCEAMLTACVKAFCQPGPRAGDSALYYMGGRYCLILQPPEAPCTALLGEYAAQTSGGELAAAYVAEHGLPIAEEDALGRISYYLV